MLLYRNPISGFFTTGFYAELNGVHSPELCAGRGCAIHDHPSDHPLNNAQLEWRIDRGILERICAHGIGHPDWDAILYERSVGRDSGFHACDGCCIDTEGEENDG